MNCDYLLFLQRESRVFVAKITSDLGRRDEGGGEQDSAVERRVFQAENMSVTRVFNVNQRHFPQQILDVHERTVAVFIARELRHNY